MKFKNEIDGSIYEEKIDFGNQSYQQLCKMAANGWDINLVAKLYKQIFSQVKIN